MKRKGITAIAAIACLAAASLVLLGAGHENGIQYDGAGNLLQPKGYAWRSWVYVGTPVTPNSLNPPAASFPEFHNVYMPPADFAHYEKTGKFRDGTILIKELVSVGATQALSRKGFFVWLGAWLGAWLGVQLGGQLGKFSRIAAPLLRQAAQPKTRSK